jgi:hypothetical protein
MQAPCREKVNNEDRPLIRPLDRRGRGRGRPGPRGGGTVVDTNMRRWADVPVETKAAGRSWLARSGVDDMQKRSTPESGQRRLGERVRALPVLVARAPWWLLLAVGLVTAALGVFLLVRPLSALAILGIYIGLSCIISGVGDLMARREDAGLVSAASGLFWIVAGVALIVWLGRSIELLGPAVAVLLIVSGWASSRWSCESVRPNVCWMRSSACPSRLGSGGAAVAGRDPADRGRALRRPDRRVRVSLIWRGASAFFSKRPAPYGSRRSRSGAAPRSSACLGDQPPTRSPPKGCRRWTPWPATAGPWSRPTTPAWERTATSPISSVRASPRRQRGGHGGVVAGAPGASLGIPFVADAYSRTYDDVELSQVVAPSALTTVKEAASRCTSERGTLLTILSGLAISRDQPILRDDPSAGGPLGRRLRDNIPSRARPGPLWS